MAFQCILVTPEAQLLDESVDQVILPAFDGLMGILMNRASLLVKLGVGPLRVDMAGSKQSNYFVDGGVAQMRDNKLTILTREATPASQIDATAAREAYAAAVARHGVDPAAVEQREHDLNRARAMQEIAGKK